MLSKLKDKLTKATEEDPETKAKKAPDVSFLTPDEVKMYRKTLEVAKASIDQIHEIATNARQDLLAFIKHQKKEPEGQKQLESITIEEDINEVRELLHDVVAQLSKIQQTEEEIKHKISGHSSNETPQKSRQLQATILKYETELKHLRHGEENTKQILSTLRQQTQLLSKQTKDLQERNGKLERQVNEKTALANNLTEQKNLLLQMRNSDSSAKNPEVEGLKAQLLEFDRRLNNERIKLQQKDKEVEVLKKRLEEDRESLEKIADELKDKELKSRKFIQKYERSKAEIRKYREEKTEFIKNLNLEVADLNEKVQRGEKHTQELQTSNDQMVTRIEDLQNQVTMNANRAVELEAVRSELGQVRQQILSISAELEEKAGQNLKLQTVNEQLQSKRKSLLEALQNPINHEIRTLEKIIRALEKLYKQYISTVFEEGNIVGFESKITYILSNVQEIKEDLIM